MPLIEKLSQEDRLRIEDFLKNQQIMRTQSYGFSVVKKISKENLPVRVPRSLESEGQNKSIDSSKVSSMHSNSMELLNSDGKDVPRSSYNRLIYVGISEGCDLTMARFERSVEALKNLQKLSHPQICLIRAIEVTNKQIFMTQEYANLPKLF